MKRLPLLLCLLSSAAWPQSMMVGVDRSDAQSYTGPGNVVSGAKGWWGLRAYSAAYAASLGKIANICISTGNTGPDTTCGDVSSDSNGNFNIAASTVSACSNTGANQCTVKTLYDQSGALNCVGPVACDLTQATVANRPLLVVPGAANGCPTTAKFCMSVVTAGGANQLVSVANMLAALTQPNISISMVYNNPVRTGDEYLLDINAGQVRNVSGFTGANLVACSAGLSGNATATDGSYHAVQCVYNGALSDINVDGSANTVNMGTNNTGTNLITMFNVQGSTTNGFGGFVQEMGMWGAQFTDPTQTNAMNTNQHGYWGF